MSARAFEGFRGEERGGELVTRESLSPYIGPRIPREVERVTIPARISTPHAERPGYFGIQLRIVWDAATGKLPSLRGQLIDLLKEDDFLPLLPAFCLGRCLGKFPQTAQLITCYPNPTESTA